MLRQIFVLAGTVYLFSVSCHMTSKSDKNDSGWLANLPFLANDINEKNVAKFFSIYPNEAILNKVKIADTLPLAKIDASICEKNADKAGGGYFESWVVPTVSAFGASEVLFELPRLKGNPYEVRVTIDDRRYFIRSPFNIDDQIAANACAEFDKSDERSLKLPAKHNLEAQLSALLQSLAPDCDFEFSNSRGWYCRFNPVSPSEVRAELSDLRNIMIRRWSRLPYILMRRIAISQQLGKVLQKGKSSFFDFDSLCNIIKHSVSEELPLVMTSSRWQSAVCDEGAEKDNRYEAAVVGLSKSLSEIEVLRQLFQKASKLGLLRFKVANLTSPLSKDFWVSLMPNTDVAANLVEISQALAQPSNAADKTTGCWHPIFGDDAQKLQLAKQLDLVGASPKSTCKDMTEDMNSQPLNPHQYFADSVTSETEFVVTNGNSKLLRLPSGSYDVSIRYHLSTAADWDHEPPLVGVTKVEWKSRRPRILIDELQPR